MKPMFFFFNDTATTEIYTLSLHDALPIYLAETGTQRLTHCPHPGFGDLYRAPQLRDLIHALDARSEEHTSELQSQSNLVCRLLLEKKKKKKASMCVKCEFLCHTPPVHSAL